MESDSELQVAKRQKKFRSAWISFAGRIAAQLIGAVATVTLGVVVLSGREAKTVAPQMVNPAAPSVLVAKPVRTQQGTVLVLLPLDRYNEVTDDTVEQVSRALATDLSQMAGDDLVQVATPRWATANAH